MEFLSPLQEYIVLNQITSLLIAFALVSLPFVAYYFYQNQITKYRLYKKHTKPKHFDYDLISLGPDGTPFISDFIKTHPKAKVVIVKASKNSKQQSYFTPSEVAKSSIDFFTGEPKLISPYEVALNGKILSAENILIATGATANIPDFVGLEKVRYYSPTTISNLEDIPQKLLILGENQMACHFAQNYTNLGSEVTLVSAMPRLLLDESFSVGDAIYQNLIQQNISVFLEARTEKFERTNQKFIAIFDKDGADLSIEFDVALFCLGDIPNTSDIGLERLEIPLNSNGTISVDSKLRTNYPTIYACGKAASYSP